MASFIAPNYIPEFNPAISTIPIDLYGKVIMSKQAQYDQGVERVQAYVQNVTGLEMGREIDDKYYQEKVGQLKTQLQSTLTSDFSQKDVINQVGSYASQLYNDKRIQNSVLSRIYEKDAYSQIAKAQEEGTFAPENAAPMLENVQRWKQGDQNATLGKQVYTPYDNYLPRLQKLMKDINPDVRIDQNSPIGTDGKPIPYVLREGKIEAITDDKVLSAYETFFQTDASARNQRSLSTNYYSRNISDESALNTLRNYNLQSNADIDKQIEFYKQQKLIYQNDLDRIGTINQNLDQLQKNKETLNTNYQNELAIFAENPNLVKANIYDREQRKSFADVYTYKKESSKLVENPVWSATFEETKFEYQKVKDIRELNAKLAEGEADRASAERIAQMKIDEERAKAATKASTESSTSTPTLTTTGASQVNPDFATPQAVSERIGNNLVLAQNEMYKMIYEGSMDNVNGSLQSTYSNLIQKVGDKYIKRPGVSNEQLSSIYANYKKAYENGTLNANSANYRIIADYFGSTDNTKGYPFLIKSVRDNQEFTNLKNSAPKGNTGLSIGEEAASEGSFFGGGIANAFGLGDFATRFGSPLPINNKVAQGNPNWTKDPAVVAFANRYSETNSYPSVSISSEQKDVFAGLKNVAIENINAQKLQGYDKILSKANGFNVTVDPQTNKYYLNILSTEGRVDPIVITEQTALRFTGNALSQRTDPYSFYKTQQMQNNGTTDYQFIKPVSNPDFQIRWSSRLVGDRQVPTIEYRYLKGGDDSPYIPIRNLGNNIVSPDMGSIINVVNQLSSYDKATFLKILEADNQNISNYLNQ